MEPRTEPIPAGVVAHLAAEYGLGDVVDCQPVPHGLMNVNWRLTTSSGTYALKRLRDRPPDDVRASQRILPRLAALGWPVPVPCRSREGEILAQAEGDWYLASGWLPGTHLKGIGLGLDECVAFGELVGRLHVALGQVCPPAARRLADVPDSAAVARAELGKYAREAADEFDLFAQPEIAWRLSLGGTVGTSRSPALN